MKRVKAYKVKGANKSQGKKIDHSRLVDHDGFARTKDEIEPKTKWTSKTYNKPKKETVQNFVDMLETKRDEDLGIY